MNEFGRGCSRGLDVANHLMATMICEVCRFGKLCTIVYNLHGPSIPDHRFLVRNRSLLAVRQDEAPRPGHGFEVSRHILNSGRFGGTLQQVEGKGASQHSDTCNQDDAHSRRQLTRP